MFYDHVITSEPYGLQGAAKPWNGPDASQRRALQVHTCDDEIRVRRCTNCPLPPEKCTGSPKCWWLLGKPEPEKLGRPPQKEKVAKAKKVKPVKAKQEKKKKEPKPPKGYDREALDRAMVHNYFPEDIAKALGIGVYRVKRWLEWRDR